LDSAALIAGGRHARTDGLVSLGVVASAACVAAGFPLGDPLVGLAITIIILHVTWQSIRTIRDAPSG
jgi:divalent metal cation (Fe/Co/Zn/Cd) transporter